MGQHESPHRPARNLVSRRRFLAATAGLSAIVTLGLSGCSSTAQPTATKAPDTKPAATTAPGSAATKAPGTTSQVTLRFGDWQLAEEPGGTAWRTIIEDFTKANPNVKVEPEAAPLAQYQTKIVTQSKSKQAPDVFKVYDTWFTQWTSQGMLADLEPFIAQAGADYKADFYKAVIDYGTYQGKTHGLPSFSGSLLLQYNTEMFQAAGLDPKTAPKDWPELLDYAQKLNKKDASGKLVQWGYGMHGSKDTSSVVRFLHWINNAGGSVLSEDMKESRLNSKECIDALTFWSGLYTQHGVVPPGATDVEAGRARSLFAQEKVAMFQSIVWAVDLVASENPKVKDKCAFAAFPSQTGKDVSPGFMFFLAMSPDTKYKEEAWKLMDYICSKEGQIKAYKIARFTPARKSAFESPDVQSDPFAQIAIKAADTVKPLPTIPQWNEIVNIIGDATQQALTKAKTPDAAFKEAHERATTVLKRA